MADSKFQKHAYGKEKKRSYVPIEEFDPRPQAYRGTASNNMSVLLDKVKGKGLCVSLLLDPSTAYWDTDPSTLPPVLPKIEELKETIAHFKQSQRLTPQQIDELERATRDQRLSPAWFSARRHRLTASKFGEILHRRNTTSPDKLVERILHPKSFKSVQTDWGIEHESVALQKYVEFQHSTGDPNLSVCPSGFIVCSDYPFLGASPDGAVFSPALPDPHGYLEIKCPYNQRNMTPLDACTSAEFCCELGEDGQMKLRRSHHYYAQVQGQMAIGKRNWCDFVIYTQKNIAVERITFDSSYWSNELQPKLVDFYDNILAPEIVSPIHCLGLPIRDLSKM